MKEINTAYEALTSPTKTAEKPTTSNPEPSFNDLLNNLIQTGLENLDKKQKNQELVKTRNRVEILLNRVIGAVNYEPIETEKGIISVEQIKSSLMSIIQALFLKGQELSKDVLENMENSFKKVSNKTKNPNQVANILVYVLQNNYDFVRKNYQFSAKDVEILIKVAEVSFLKLPKELQENENIIIHKDNLRKLKHESVK